MDDGHKSYRPLAPLDNFLPQVAPYADRLLFFERTAHDCEAIVQHLRDAFDQTLQAIPGLSGTVISISHDTQKGRLALAAPYRTAQQLITLRHLAHIDYVEMRRMHFPMSFFKEDEVWPPSMRDAQPAIHAQVNFVDGGIILAIRAAHCVTDGHGLQFILKIWATFSSGQDGFKHCGPDPLYSQRLMYGVPADLKDFGSLEQVSPEQQRTSSRSIDVVRRLWRLLSHALYSSTRTIMRVVSDLLTYRNARVVFGPRKAVDEGAQQNVIFFFPLQKLQRLKHEVMTSAKSIEKDAGPRWISTHDVLVSLLWCCVTETWKTATNYASRDTNPKPLLRFLWQYKLRVREPVSVLGFFMNGRPLIQNPPLQPYVGNVVLASGIGGGFSSVNPSITSVTRYAHEIRRKILEMDENYVLRLVGAMSSAPDLSRVRINHGAFPESAIRINSWANMSSYADDWGEVVGGRTQRVRITKFQSDPIALVMPKLDATDGWKDSECGLEVAVQLKSVYMKALMDNKFFRQFAKYRSD